jgi:hypothetical protein
VTVDGLGGRTTGWAPSIFRSVSVSVLRRLTGLKETVTYEGD